MGHGSADRSPSEHPARGGHRAVHRRSLRAVPSGPGVGDITPGYRIWLHVDGVRMFGPGTHELLRHVEDTGSLHRAAKLMGMSYTKAWHLLRKTEEHLGWPLVERHVGGAAGGGTSLTRTGPRPPASGSSASWPRRTPPCRTRSRRRSATGRRPRSRGHESAVDVWRPRPLAEATPAGHPIYRELVTPIELGHPVTSCVAGLVWTLVETGGDAGLALTLHDGVFESQLPGRIHGAETRWLADHITSWNMFDASLALGAVNAWFNRRDRVERCWAGRSSASVAPRCSSACRSASPAGRSPSSGTSRTSSRSATTARSRSSSGTRREATCPTRPCEYLLGRQDCVCITGSAVSNKTLPRLLELSRDAYVVLVGPSVPLTTMWFDYGVDLLAGTVVLDTAVALARPAGRPPLAVRRQPRHGRARGRALRGPGEAWSSDGPDDRPLTVRLGAHEP